MALKAGLPVLPVGRGGSDHQRQAAVENDVCFFSIVTARRSRPDLRAGGLFPSMRGGFTACLSFRTNASIAGQQACREEVLARTSLSVIMSHRLALQVVKRRAHGLGVSVPKHP